MMFRSMVLSCCRRAYRVVVLPLPVGPTTRKSPYGFRSMDISDIMICCGIYKESRDRSPLRGSRIRSSTFSPSTVGIVENRKSTAVSFIRKAQVPSCGVRVTAISSPDMIFSRLTTWGTCTAGSSENSCRAPSLRNRTRMPDDIGSKWISLAWPSTAVCMMDWTMSMALMSIPRSNAHFMPKEDKTQETRGKKQDLYHVCWPQTLCLVSRLLYLVFLE